MAASNQAAAKKPAAAANKTRAKKKPAAKVKARAKAKTKAKTKAAAGNGKSPPAGYSRTAWDKKPAGRNVPEQAMIKALRAEHRHIATVMQLFLDQLKAIEAGELVDTHVVYEIMDYMASWPDRYHHPREDLIYGRVAEIDAGLADSVDSLQRDHDRTAKSGRELLKTIERWREGEVSGAVLVKSGRAYIDHMYEHMNAEEKLVFPQIQATLSAADWVELAEDDRLRPVGDPVFGTRVQREYRNMARKLRRNVRRGVERGTMVEWVAIEALMESLEVMSMAYESIRSSTREHLRVALDDTREMYRTSFVSAPFRSTSNNARLGLRLLEDVAEISRDALLDISRVNQERKDRIRLLDQ